jgi:hypothetical protein
VALGSLALVPEDPRAPRRSFATRASALRAPGPLGRAPARAATECPRSGARRAAACARGAAGGPGDEAQALGISTGAQYLWGPGVRSTTRATRWGTAARAFWTVDDAVAMRALVDAGAEGIMTPIVPICSHRCWSGASSERSSMKGCATGLGGRHARRRLARTGLLLGLVRLWLARVWRRARAGEPGARISTPGARRLPVWGARHGALPPAGWPPGRTSAFSSSEIEARIPTWARRVFAAASRTPGAVARVGRRCSRILTCSMVGRCR